MKLLKKFDPGCSLLKIPEIKKASIIFIFSFIPVLIVTLVFQLMINPGKLYNHQNLNFTVSKNYNLKYLLYYLSVSCAHIIVSFFSIIFFINRTKFGLDKKTNRILARFRYFYIFILVLVYYIVDYLELNISILSHKRVFDILKKSDFWEHLFKSFPMDFIKFIKLDLFYLFSIFPFLLILFGLIGIVAVIFLVSREITKFQNISTKQKDAPNCMKEIDKTIENMKSFIYIMSAILTTSTLATVLYFQLPTTIFQGQNLQTQFQQTSYAMGFCWGVTFSMTMIFMCSYPVKVIFKKINEIIHNEKFLKDDEFKKWLSESNMYSLSFYLKSLISIMSPVIISLISQVVS